jgi:hypothetical protein
MATVSQFAQDDPKPQLDPNPIQNPDRVHVQYADAESDPSN